MSAASRLIDWLGATGPSHRAYYWFRVALGTSFVVDAVLGVQHLASYVPRWGVQIAHVWPLDVLPALDAGSAAVLLTLQAAAAALLAFGPRASWRGAAVLLAVTYGGLVLRNIDRGQNHEYLFTMLLVWLALCPPVSPDEPGGPERQPLATIVRWQLAFVYLFAGLNKLNPRFLSGQIVLEMGWLDGLPVSPPIDAAVDVAAWLSVGVAGAELLLAQLLLLPRMRGAALVVAAVVHGGILLAGPSPQVMIFNVAVLSCYVLWLPESVLGALSRVRRVLLRVPARLSRAWAVIPLVWVAGAVMVADHFGPLFGAGSSWVAVAVGGLALSAAIGWRVTPGPGPHGSPWPSLLCVAAIVAAVCGVMTADGMTIAALDRMERRFPHPEQASLAHLDRVTPPPRAIAVAPRLLLVAALTPAPPGPPGSAQGLDLRLLDAALDAAPALGEGGRRVDELRVDAEVALARGELDHRAYAPAAHRLTALAAFRPYRWDIHHELGVAHWELGRMDHAEQDYRRAIGLGAYPLPSMQQLTRLLVEAGRLEEAVSLLAEARDRHYGDADALEHLGRLTDFWQLGGQPTR